MEKAASLVDRFRIVGTVLASLGRTVRCRVGIGGDRARYVGWKNRIQRTADDRYCS